MVTVAVAGGTGGLGRTIVEAMQAAGQQHQVVILSRKSGKVSELPGHVPVYQFLPKEIFQGMLSIFGCWFAQGWFDLKPEMTLNQIFPDIAPRKAKDVVGKAAAIPPSD